MGLDWRTIDMAEYLEALSAYAEMNSPEPEKKQASPGLMRFVKAHAEN